jgi:hypothetical protein
MENAACEATHIESSDAIGVFDERFLGRRPDDLGMQSGHAPFFRRDDPTIYGFAANQMRESERSKEDRDDEIGMTPAGTGVPGAGTAGTGTAGGNGNAGGVGNGGNSTNPAATAELQQPIPPTETTRIQQDLVSSLAHVSPVRRAPTDGLGRINPNTIRPPGGLSDRSFGGKGAGFD